MGSTVLENELGNPLQAGRQTTLPSLAAHRNRHRHLAQTALLEAVQALGSSQRQTLRKVESPHAIPQIMAGLNQTIMLSLSIVVIVAIVGTDGLGVPVARATSGTETDVSGMAARYSWVHRTPSSQCETTSQMRALLNRDLMYLSKKSMFIRASDWPSMAVAILPLCRALAIFLRGHWKKIEKLSRICL